MIHRTLRPREKLSRSGQDALKDWELLALILKTGTPKKNVLTLSKQLLKKYPKDQLLKTSLQRLKKEMGLGPAKASSLIASFALTQRLIAKEENSLPTIGKPKDILPYVQDIRDRKKEHFMVLYLDARNHMVYRETISVGTLNATMVHPREVFAPALQQSAATIILVHNHPSGDCSPSKEDIQLTSQLVQAGDVLDIQILDHMIVSKTHFLSLKEQGYL